MVARMAPHRIYKITNTLNGKVYIGQAKDSAKRWGTHLSAVRLRKPAQVIHHAMIKHGAESFTFEVIASCLDQAAADQAEEQCIRQESSHITVGGYNVSAGGPTSPKTDAWRRQLSVVLKGRHLSRATEFAKGHPQFNRPEYLFPKGHVPYNKGLPPERQSRFGAKNGPKQRTRASECRSGRVASQETREKIRRAAKAQTSRDTSGLRQQAAAFSREQEGDIMRALANGSTVKQLAALHSVSIQTIYCVKWRNQKK